MGSWQGVGGEGGLRTEQTGEAQQTESGAHTAEHLAAGEERRIFRGANSAGLADPRFRWVDAGLLQFVPLKRTMGCLLNRHTSFHSSSAKSGRIVPSVTFRRGQVSPGSPGRASTLRARSRVRTTA